MIKAVVFDLDETLISSKDGLIQFFRELFDFVGKPFPEDNQKPLYTAPEKGFLRSLFSDDKVLEAARNFRDNYNLDDHLKTITPKPYAIQTIKSLHKKYKLAIATNRGPTTDPILSYLKITEYFDYVVMSRTLAATKPHPLVLDAISKKLEVSADQIIFIGDSIIDVETAKNGNCHSVIVKTVGENHLGDYQIDDLSELEALIEKLNLGQQ